MKTLTIDIEEINIEEIDSLYSKMKNDEEIRCIVFKDSKMYYILTRPFDMNVRKSDEYMIHTEVSMRKLNKIIKNIPNTITHLEFTKPICWYEKEVFKYLPQSILKIKNENNHIMTREEIKKYSKQTSYK